MQTEIMGNLPDPPVIMRHVGLLQTEALEGIVHGIGKTRHASDIGTFADTLGADRMMRARCLSVIRRIVRRFP